MDQGKPGIWIGGAVVLAVIIVALSIPRTRDPAPVPTSADLTTLKGPGTSATPPPVGEATSGAEPSVPEAGLPSPGRTLSLPTDTPTVPQTKLPVQLPPLSPNVSRENGTQALDNVQFAIRDYRAALGGNPVGTNSEITSALFGDNAKQIRQPMPDGSRINGNGELCDPWGTPYFFHQQNAQKMEVRSAGPDLQMWTSDDLQL